MGQLAFESGTESIPTNVVGYAIASAHREVELKFSCHSIQGTGNEVVELNVANPDQRTEAILYESYIAGWPWVIADMTPGASVSSSWINSRPVLGQVLGMIGGELTECDAQLHTAVSPRLEEESPFRMVLTPFNQGGVVLGLLRDSVNPRILDIRRLGIALAAEWIDAWSSKETTRGILINETAKLDVIYAHRTHSSRKYDGASKSGQQAECISDSKENLRALESLSNDWNGYGAEAPNQIALENARAVLESLGQVDLQPSRIIPSAAGGVSLCFFRPMKYAEIECYNSGESVAIIKDTRTNWRDIWDVESITQAVRKILEFLKD